MSSLNTSDNLNPDELVTYIFPDFNAIKHFQRDFISSNEFHLIEESISSGFDVYLVEQWVLNRKMGTIISTYTGNTEMEVPVIKFTVLKKPVKLYPLRFQEYINELMLNHAKVKKMVTDVHIPEELLFVTNSAALPSNINLIPIPNGDMWSLENDFIVNSNLKKLQCSGRSLSLFTNKVSGANEDKFRYVYKIFNDNVPVKFAIKELVNLIQICLFYFDLLEAKYCDGLLCNKTEESIIEWWNLIGLPHYNVKPNPKNGILPSRTVAAIISLIISVKLRLQIIGGCDVPKDPFDFENFMISIGQFQKQYKIDKRRKLDLQTLSRLFAITNAKLIPDKNNPGYNVTENISVDSMNPSYSNYSLPPNVTKKNKNYYSMEFKKLTNVVKSTVQDRIIAPNKDNDDSYNTSNTKSSGVRIRNKIAKLAENTSPLDVETLDLEILVKNYLTGKILSRLWFGINNASSGQPDSSNHQAHQGNDHSHRHHSHHHHRQHATTSDLNSKQYRFVSLKDAISNTQDTPYYANATSSTTDVSRYSKGLRMKLGLQNRRPKKKITSQFDDVNNENNNVPLMANNSTSVLDSLLNPKDIGTSCDGNSDKSSHHSEPDNTYVTNFKRNLNRRNSYPFIIQKGEANLNIIEFLRDDHDNEDSRFSVKRSSSFSLIEDYFCTKSEKPLLTFEKLTSNYLQNMNNLVKIDNLNKAYNSDSFTGFITVQKIDSLYKKLNHQVVTFNHTHNQMMNNKSRVIEGDLAENLNFNIDDLSATIDRLIYETRIVVKRVNEFEENCESFDNKLKNGSVKKLDTIIDKLIYLNKFRQVFVDENERNDIVIRLTGKDLNELNYYKISNQSQSDNILRIIILFIYDMIAYIFQLFKIDRSKMNLERIRQSWRKLDPNRKYTNKIYSIIGKEHSKNANDSHETVD